MHNPPSSEIEEMSLCYKCVKDRGIMVRSHTSKVSCALQIPRAIILCLQITREGIRDERGGEDEIREKRTIEGDI